MPSEQSPSSVILLLVVQLIATCGMLGVIWFVQLVTYPQFSEIGEADFINYHQHYSTRVTWIVAPLMLVELGTGFIGLFYFWKTPFFAFATAGFLIIIALWALTAFVQVPQHGKLFYGYSMETIRDLVKWNWTRTILWTLRTFLVVVLLFRYLSSKLTLAT